MKLTTTAQAEAFVFFMLNEKNRHLDDIRQINGTVLKVAKAFDILIPWVDPKEKHWVTVDDGDFAKDRPPVINMSSYPRNPILADED
jgi:hypothetical protein